MRTWQIDDVDVKNYNQLACGWRVDIQAATGVGNNPRQCAARLTEALRRNAQIAGRLHKAMGAMFVALGLRLAVEKA